MRWYNSSYAARDRKISGGFHPQLLSPAAFFYYLVPDCFDICASYPRVLPEKYAQKFSYPGARARKTH